MKKRSLVAFAGFKRSGKSASAEHLAGNFAYFRASFADPLRFMGRSIGLTAEQLTEFKDLPCERLGQRTGRDFMKAMGEAGRGMWPDMWAELLRHRIEPLLDGGVCVVVDDARRENEVKTLHDLGGIVVWVNRPGVVSDGSSTEQDIRHLCDMEIDNEGTLSALWAAVEHIAIKKKDES